MTISPPETLKVIGFLAEEMRRGRVCLTFETRTFRANEASTEGGPAAPSAVSLAKTRP